MTTESTSTDNATRRGGSRLSEGLGPLPAAVPMCDRWALHHKYSAEEMEAERQRCYALGVAAERERCAKLCIARSVHFANDEAARSFAGLVIHGRA